MWSERLSLKGPLSLAAVSAVVEGVLLLSVAGTLTSDRVSVGLPSWWPPAPIQVLVMVVLLFVVLAGRYTASCAFLDVSGRLRRSMEGRLARLVVDLPLRDLERDIDAASLQALTVDIDRVVRFIADLRAFVPATITCFALVSAMIVTSLVYSAGFAIALTLFCIALRLRTRVVVARELRLSSEREIRDRTLHDGRLGACEIRLVDHLRSSFLDHVVRARRRDAGAELSERRSLGRSEVGALGSLLGFALLLTATRRLDLLSQGDEAARFGLLVVLALGPMMTMSVLQSEVVAFQRSWSSLSEAIGSQADANGPVERTGVVDGVVALRYRRYAFTYDGAVSANAVTQISNATIRKGHITFIIGGNGSGKTTVAKMICGLYSPKSGIAEAIYRDGSSVSLQSADLRSLFTGVFAEGTCPIFDSLPPMDDRFREHLVALELDEKVRVDERTLHTDDLSYGERRRLDLALALASDKDWIVLDETAANQSPHMKVVLYRSFLRELAGRGKGLVVITHDEGFIDGADQVIRVDGGLAIVSRSIESALS